MIYEIHEGLSGRGIRNWLVVAVNEAGVWTFTHTFDSKAEAEVFAKWA